MKLEKFKEKNKKKKSVILFSICCILLIISVFFYQSFALFETKDNFNFIEGNVSDPGDLYFAYYVDDVLTYDIPSKDSGYTLSSKTSCTNGVTISWNDETWSAIVNYSTYKKENNSRVKCTLYFEEKQTPVDPKDYIIAKAPEGTLIEDDETVDHNMRYIGANPNNYIDIGDRDSDGNVILWRIIGVMNHIKSNAEDEIGETRLKIVRSESIGSFPWDISDSTINKGQGVNEWSQSGLNILLNSYYFNRVKRDNDCYANSNIISCDFTQTGLSENAKKMIGETLWNTGAMTYGNIDKATLSYTFERGSLTGRGNCSSGGGNACNDTVVRTINWIGFIGLSYPSDHFYATDGGGKSEIREQCLVSGFGGTSACYRNSWLSSSVPNVYWWTLTPNYADSSYGPGRSGVYSICYGQVNTAGSKYKLVIPTTYLKSSVKIISGDGTQDSPFQVSL